jgi:diguanylate cyclase
MPAIVKFSDPIFIAALVSTALAVVALLGCWLLWQRSRTAMRSHEQLTRQLSSAQNLDAITGLSTPSKFDSELEDAALRSDANGQPICVLYLDIDHFRSANDAFGRAAGDGVLKELATRINALLKPGCPATRLGGNEFALLLAAPLKDAQALASQLLARLATPVVLPSGEARLTCSIGIASYPAQGSRRNIVERAAAAMRTVKLQGGDGFAEFDQQAADGRRESARLLHDLRCAVERREFELFYQPKIDATSLQITAVEALVRWRHPKLGMVGPDRFIPLAERYGVIQGIGCWVIEEACRQAQAWRGQGLRMRIAVNISGHQLRQDGFIEHLEGVLQATQTPPSRFTCEITESIAMEDTAATMAAFDRLGALGVHVSIDDFGTGHSSLASLRRLPAQELKIDRAFVADLGVSEHAHFIANTIVNMAHALNLKVVAEGVETREQRDMLVGMGCDELQGYLFAKPMRAEDLSLWAARDPRGAVAQFRPSLYSETEPHQIV